MSSATSSPRWVGAIRREPSQRLDPLTLARDRPAARLLVRRDDDVDETLEEIALLGPAGTPRLFERFVRLEERARPPQGEPAVV